MCATPRVATAPGKPNASVSDTLRAVRATPFPGPVLSVLLATFPERMLGEGHVIAFHDACKALRPQVDERERGAFEHAVAQVDAYLARQPDLGAPGLAIYAGGEPDQLWATTLPTRPVDRIVWDAQPAIEPLIEALDDAERIAVLLIDKERGRLFTIRLGEIEERHAFFDEVPGKQATGGWFGLSQARYARHHEDHVLRHVKHTIRMLTEELRSHPFDRLVIGGPDEAMEMLVHHLPRPLRGRFAGTISLPLFAPEADVLAAARDAATAIERRDELADIQALIDDAATPHVAIGLDDTLAALSEGRAHRLFAAATLSQGGARCEACGRLTVDVIPCPACGAATTPIADLREGAVEQAVDQGARVDIVSGAAADLLMARGGLGARTRH